MCFSVQADLVAGGVLLPVGVMTLREVKQRRELLFALLPLLFAVHQLVEAFVWAGVDGDVSQSVQHAAALAYVVYALPVLPTLVPLAVLLLEPRRLRLRVTPFVVLGLVVSGVFAEAVFAHPVRVIVHPHALEYQTGSYNSAVWTTLYVVAVIGPSVLSGYKSIVTFGVLNLVGLSVFAVIYVEAFASLWCVYAALISVLVLVHMVRRRRLPDSDRIAGLRVIPGFR